jgi:predicted aspartyl protease
MNAGKMRSVYLDVTIDSVSSKFIFDTGFNGKIKADSSFFNALKAKNKGAEFVTQSGLVVTDLNGKITGQTFMVIAKDIDVQGVQISDQMISLTGINKALVGNEFFENFTLTIDWQHDKLFLDPINEIKPDTLEAFEFSFSTNFISNKKTF